MEIYVSRAESRFKKCWWNLIKIVFALELISREYSPLKSIDKTGMILDMKVSSVLKRMVVVVFI